MSTPALPVTTQLPSAQANVITAITAWVNTANDSLRAAWATTSSNFLADWGRAGYTDPNAAPKPPLSWVVGSYVDPTSGTGNTGGGPYGNSPVPWGTPTQTGPPIAPPIVLPPIAEQVHPVFTGNDQRQNVPPGDTMPVGAVILAPDGSKWEKIASPTPFGIATYYAKVA